MSIRVMSDVIDCAPELKGGPYVVLLMMANWADDDGGSIFPTLETLAKKARLSVRATQYALRELEDAGFIEKVETTSGRPGWANEYKINVRRVQNLQPSDTGANDDGDGCKTRQRRVQSTTRRVQNATAYIEEPSLQPSCKPLGDPPCAEPLTRSAPVLLALDKTVIELPTNKKGEVFAITDRHVAEMRELYPAADVDQQLRSMKGWLIANPTKRKTHSGMLRFAHNWLSRAQNEGRTNGNGAHHDRNQSPRGNFASTVSARVAARAGGDALDRGGPEIVDVTPRRTENGTGETARGTGHEDHAGGMRRLLEDAGLGNPAREHVPERHR